MPAQETDIADPRTPDAADAELIERVRPPGWPNPVPAPMYDLVVLGGGTAGLVSAMGAAGLGARVALVERHRLGGDCLNTGCVPSKAIIRSARVAGELTRAAALGVFTSDVTVDFGAVMARMRQRRASIAANDSADRLRRAGVDVFFGDAAFTDARTVEVLGQRLRFRRAVIATGGRPTAPPVPGLESVPYLTNETIFALTRLPERLLVIGAGPIGCELAQAFARFGSRVTIFDQAPRALPRDDPDAAAIVQRHLEADGIRVELGVTLQRVERTDAGPHVHFRRDAIDRVQFGSEAGDVVLVAAGRARNVEGLRLEAAGVQANRRGIVVNDRLQTSNRRVYASGDVCSAYQFTHAADAMSRIVLQNALFFGRRRASALTIPWVTYTDPEIAHVGVSVTDVAQSNGRLATITIPLSDVDRAVVDDETDGFVRVHHERGRLRGCTIVARHAGEMIGEATYAIAHGGTLRRQAVTPGMRRWLERYFRWTR